MGYVVAVVGVFAGASASEGSSNNPPVLLGLLGVGTVLMVARPVVWCVKTNGALNRDWQSAT